MKHLIIGNWKMNPESLREAKRLFNSVKRNLRIIRNIEVVICPPFVYLPFFQPFKNLKLGAQDCFWEEKGAFTGEVSPLMLKKLGCQYVIVGHSERERYLGETDEMANKKIKAAILVGLKPIFCIGETWIERKHGKTKKILESQIKKGLNKVSNKEIQNITIAYEPVWAIGTGNSCDPVVAQKSALFIRKLITRKYSNSTAQGLRIIYGGSINSQNARDFIKKAGFQGFIVGGASLNPKEFIKILKNID